MWESGTVNVDHCEIGALRHAKDLGVPRPVLAVDVHLEERRAGDDMVVRHRDATRIDDEPRPTPTAARLTFFGIDESTLGGDTHDRSPEALQPGHDTGLLGHGGRARGDSRGRRACRRGCGCGLVRRAAARGDHQGHDEESDGRTTNHRSHTPLLLNLWCDPDGGSSIAEGSNVLFTAAFDTAFRDHCPRGPDSVGGGGPAVDPCRPAVGGRAESSELSYPHVCISIGPRLLGGFVWIVHDITSSSVLHPTDSPSRVGRAAFGRWQQAHWILRRFSCDAATV